MLKICLEKRSCNLFTSHVLFFVVSVLLRQQHDRRQERLCNVSCTAILVVCQSCSEGTALVALDKSVCQINKCKWMSHEPQGLC